MIKTEISNPRSKTEILSALEDVAEKVESYYSSLSPEQFFHDGLGGWSAAQNLSHITFIGSLAVYLFGFPRFLFIPFGKQTIQRDFVTLKNDYLSSDKTIYIGPLAPSSIAPPLDAKNVIQTMTSDWRKVYRDLNLAIQSIPEEDMDNFSLPHPSMGMLSLREMIYVIIIHPIHHTYKVEQKMERVTR
jgi:hypothetical protein